ncbi:MAG TPA: phospho-N-acetylmuramoyl-pentapeptide-transferase [Pirellulales bacterium]|nr:phospho-N-acetylmuramoyl-pentapeptide-transferase [Pirellulales bacterium]
MHDLGLALLAAATAYLLAALLGPGVTERLRRLCRERIDTASPKLAKLHAAKSGTPSMGGLLIVGCWLAAVALCCDLGQPAVLIAVAATLAFAVLGVCDDAIKARGRRRGLSVRAKLSGQAAIAVATVAALAIADDWNGRVDWLLYAPLAVMLIMGMSNAVNVTDGLDGLAGGCGAIAATALALIALLVPSAGPGDAERNRQVALLAAALAGALAGFLRLNRAPARLFMGDTGSLPLGGLLALLAILSHLQWLLLFVGGVFVAELASVVLQVVWFRRTGRRLFLCAPLHHHFEFLGWPEPTIVRRCWTVAGALAVGGCLAFAPAIWTRPRWAAFDSIHEALVTVGEESPRMSSDAR